MKVLVLNGPNLDRLGAREPEIYGSTTLAEVEELLRKRAAELGAEVECRQTGDEATFVRWVAEGAADAIVMNPAALTHHSRALREAVEGCGVPVYEVHISNIAAREPYRRRSLVSGVARGSIVGLGVRGYLLALEAAVKEASA